MMGLGFGFLSANDLRRFRADESTKIFEVQL